MAVRAMVVCSSVASSMSISRTVCKGMYEGGVGRIMNHQDQRDALADVAFWLNDRRNPYARFPEDSGDPCERAGFVHHVEAKVVAGDGLGDGEHGAFLFMSDKGRN